jgi:hypothetical protein
MSAEYGFLRNHSWRWWFNLILRFPADIAEAGTSPKTRAAVEAGIGGWRWHHIWGNVCLLRWTRRHPYLLGCKRLSTTQILFEVIESCRENKGEQQRDQA